MIVLTEFIFSRYITHIFLRLNSAFKYSCFLSRVAKMKIIQKERERTPGTSMLYLHSKKGL
jgi:hypothetical protein